MSMPRVAAVAVAIMAHLSAVASLGQPSVAMHTASVTTSRTTTPQTARAMARPFPRAQPPTLRAPAAPLPPPMAHGPYGSKASAVPAPLKAAAVCLAALSALMALPTFFLPRPRPAPVLMAAVEPEEVPLSRRGALTAGAAFGGLALQLEALAASLPEPATPDEVLCDAACAAKLADIPRIKTPSGLEYQDIIVGTGPQPPLTYQITINLVAMLPSGKVFSNTLKDFPLEVRIGSGGLVKGLEEGLTTMRVGGLRRLYVPGELAFQNNIKAAPGSPAILARTPIIFDVQLLVVPGLEEEDDGVGAFDFQ